MSKNHSTAPGKPGKPSPDFPLPAPRRLLVSEEQGKNRIFGPWGDPDAIPARSRFLARPEHGFGYLLTFAPLNNVSASRRSSRSSSH